MSDIPPPPEFSLEDDATDTSAESAEKRTWRRVFKLLKWDLIISNSVAVLTTSIVAVTAMYATLSTSNSNLEESRRGARVSALVEEWSVTIADAAAAIELLDERANDLWAFGAAYEQEGVVLDEAMANEASKEKEYLKVRQNIAFSSAKAGLVSSTVTNKCLDKFIAMIDTWQNALNWTRSSLQLQEGVQSGIEAVTMQQDNRVALSGSLTIVRELARTELDTAGTDGSSVKCEIPEEDKLWSKLVPEEEAGN